MAIKAAAYYRMSSDSQDMQSQRDAVPPWAKANGYGIVRDYVDEARQGWRDDRKAFQQLIADAERGEFQAIVCWDQDRFCRFPPLEANHYWFLLDRAGVHIATVNQGRLDFDSLAGWLTASITQHSKAEYCRDLAKNTVRGLAPVRLGGRWCGSAPYGYVLNKETGRLEVGDAAECHTILSVYQQRAQGLGYWLIAKRLTEAGVRPRKAAAWSVQGIRHILQCDAYRGVTVVGKHASGEYLRLSPGPVELPGTHPAIVSDDLWAAVRAVEAANTGKASYWRGDENSGGALSGLMYCGRCGSAMYHKRYKARPHLNHYCCGRNHLGQGCGYCRVEADEMQTLIVAKVIEALDPAQLRKALKRRTAARSVQQPKAATVAALDAKIARAAKRLVQVDDSLFADVQAELLKLKAQRAKLVAVPVATESLADAIDRIEGMLDDLRNTPANRLRSSLSQFIRRIDLEFEPLRVTPTGRQRFIPVGGVVQMFLNGSKAPEGFSPIWNTRVKLTRADLRPAA